jgi:hypothetical protein
MPTKPNASDRSSMKPDLPGEPPVTPKQNPCNPVANPSRAGCPDQQSQPPKPRQPNQRGPELKRR